MVQNIEEFGAKLRPQSLCDLRIFAKRGIQIRETGADQRISSYIAISAGSWNDVGVRIEILRGAALNHAAMKSGIDGGSNRVAAVSIIRRIESKLRSERKT